MQPKIILEQMIKYDQLYINEGVKIDFIKKHILKIVGGSFLLGIILLTVLLKLKDIKDGNIELRLNRKAISDLVIDNKIKLDDNKKFFSKIIGDLTSSTGFSDVIDNSKFTNFINVLIEKDHINWTSKDKQIVRAMVNRLYKADEVSHNDGRGRKFLEQFYKQMTSLENSLTGKGKGRILINTFNRIMGDIFTSSEKIKNNVIEMNKLLMIQYENKVIEDGVTWCVRDIKNPKEMAVTRQFLDIITKKHPDNWTPADYKVMKEIKNNKFGAFHNVGYLWSQEYDKNGNPYKPNINRDPVGNYDVLTGLGKGGRFSFLGSYEKKGNFLKEDNIKANFIKAAKIFSK